MASSRRGRGRGAAWRYDSTLTEAFSSLSINRGERWAGGSGRGPGWQFAAAASTAAQRYNVARLPELEYFCRKLSEPDDPKWSLPFAKSDSCAALPEDFNDTSSYLSAMQSAAALEFQASVKEALELADREACLGRTDAAGAWHPFLPLTTQACGRAGMWAYAGEAGGVDFEQDSWGRHLVEVRETQSFHVAVMAKRDDETEEHVMALLPTELRYADSCGALSPATAALLSAVVRLSAAARSSCGTLLYDKVDANDCQVDAVARLRGGLSVIHGPPGSGKSTTVYHIFDARVARDKQVLVTCTRNQAVDAVVEKVALLEGGVLVFGNPARLGECAARHTIDGRVEHLPMVVEELTVWRGKIKDLQLGVLLRQYDENELLSRVVWHAMDAAAHALEELRPRIKRELLAGARVFVATIDATALGSRAAGAGGACWSERSMLGVNAGSLFIVTLYNRQRSLILDLLAQQGGGARLRRAYRQIAVLSADACQGSEADVVVISTVRNVSARGTTAAQLSQFFLDARRTNVALSRARHLSVVVGSAATLRQAAHRAPFWGHLLEHYRT
eukprot:scaffold5.g604.t1